MVKLLVGVPIDWCKKVKNAMVRVGDSHRACVYVYYKVTIIFRDYFSNFTTFVISAYYL